MKHVGEDKIGFWLRTLKEGNNLRDLDASERILLKMFLEKCYVLIE
jgi:hypothetical protein